MRSRDLPRRTARDQVERDDLTIGAARAAFPASATIWRIPNLKVRKREEMMARGVRSVAAVPARRWRKLRRPTGSARRQEGFFDDAEMRLLSELASGVSDGADPRHGRSRRRRRQELDVDAQLIHELWDETPDAIIAVGPEGSILEWNRAAEIQFLDFPAPRPSAHCLRT